MQPLVVSTGRVLILIVTCFSLTVKADVNHIPPRLASTLNHISGLIYNDQFDQAESMIDSLEQNDGPIAFCHFFRAVLYQSQMMAAESDFLREEYFTTLDSLESEAERMLSQNIDSALAYYFLGNAHAFRSLYHGRAGGIFKALKSGLAARKAYGRGYEIDSTFHDIALGLGSYRYWKSVKTKAINWTPLFKDERREGIDLLRRAADSSEISSGAAIVSLIWVYINEKSFDRAIRLATTLRNKYPEGLTFLWALGEAYHKMGNCRASIAVYDTLLNRFRKTPGNYFNFVEVSYYLSKCYRKQTDLSPEFAGKLIKVQTEIRTSPIPEKTRKRQKSKIKEILKKIH